MRKQLHNVRMETATVLDGLKTRCIGSLMRSWSCAEWELDGPTNTMHFWLDTAPLGDLTMSGTGQGCVHQPATFTWAAPQFDRIDLGFESYQADSARTIWIDDVALGTKRLGCPAPQSKAGRDLLLIRSAAVDAATGLGLSLRAY